MDIKSKWFYDYCTQVFKLKFISTGGILKGILKDDTQPKEDEELINVSDEEHSNGDVKEIIDFKWFRKVKRYKRVFE